LERARRFFVRAWQSFGGPSLRGTGWKRQRGIWKNNPRINQMGEWRAAIKNLAAVADRMRKVQIEHDDALKVIKNFDSPDTLFYCDPPYPGECRSRQHRQCYAQELTANDHVHLFNALNRIKGLALVSTYPNDLYAEIFAAWPSVTTTCQTTNHSKIATEQLYISPRAYDKKRQLRELANASDGKIISGQRGYRHIRHATLEEIEHAANWLEHQAVQMGERARSIRRLRHTYHPNRNP
jgi:DNA adenine methylase